MNIQVDLDLLDHAGFVVRWDDVVEAVAVKLEADLGRKPDECDFDPESSDSGTIRCHFGAGGMLDLPFSVEIDLGLVAERIAHQLINHPLMASKGYKLIGGSISTESNGDIRIYPSRLPVAKP